MTPRPPYFLSHHDDKDLGLWFDWFKGNGIPCGVIRGREGLELWRMGREAGVNHNTDVAVGELLKSCYGFGETMMGYAIKGEEYSGSPIWH